MRNILWLFQRDECPEQSPRCVKCIGNAKPLMQHVQLFHLESRLQHVNQRDSITHLHRFQMHLMKIHKDLHFQILEISPLRNKGKDHSPFPVTGNTNVSQPPALKHSYVKLLLPFVVIENCGLFSPCFFVQGSEATRSEAVDSHPFFANKSDELH